MGKADDMLQNLGEKVGESIGVRAQESSRPVARKKAAAQTGSFARSNNVGEVPIDDVIPDPNQPREHFDQAEISRLADSVKKMGLLQPIRVRWSEEESKWVVIAGERRLRAAKQAGLEQITCMFVQREITESDVRAEALVENLLRQDLSPLEEARGFKTLMETNSWNASQLSKNLNVSNAKVSKALSLLKLPEETQQQLEKGTLSINDAYATVKKSTGGGKGRSTASKPVTIRCLEGSVIVKPKAGHPIEKVLRNALRQLREESQTAAA